MTDRDPCASRHGGAETSVEAFKETSDKQRQKQRKTIILAIKLSGKKGLTTEEVSDQTKIRYSTCSARISELTANGDIHHMEERRRTSSGSTARIHYAGPMPLAKKQGRLFA